MGLWKRETYWWITYRDPQGVMRRESTRIPVDGGSPAQTRENKNRAQATLARKIITQIDSAQGRGAADPRPTTFGAFATWYDTHVIAHHRGASRERELLADLRREFGAGPIAKITRQRVAAWMTRRLSEARTVQTKAGPVPGAPPTAATVNRTVDLLKSMLREAVQHGYLTASPLVGMKRLHAPRRPKARLTSEQEDAVLREMRHPGDRAMLIMGLDTLARLGDILDFRRDHDHGRTLTLVDPKNGELLEVPVSARLRAVLDALPEVGPYYFAHRRTAQKPREWASAVRQMLERACKRAGVPYGRAQNAITWHAATRRTGASRMIAAKVPLPVVMRIGGWKTLEQVSDYVVPEDDALREAVEAVGRRSHQDHRGPDDTT